MSVVPINVGRPRSVRLVEELAGRESALVGVITQRDSETVEPTFKDLYSVGTLARVVKVIRLNKNATYDLVRRKVIPSIKVGRRILVSKKAVIRWLENNGQ